MSVSIQVILESTLLTLDQLAPMVQAVQTQVSRDLVASGWNAEAQLNILPAGQKPDNQQWWLVVFTQ